jgi:hypothetical protein
MGRSLVSPECLVSTDKRFSFCMQVRLGALGQMTHFADDRPSCIQVASNIYTKLGP